MKHVLPIICAVSAVILALQSIEGWQIFAVSAVVLYFFANDS